MSRRDSQAFLPGFEPPDPPARLDDPRTPGPPARLDDPRTLMRIEQVVEEIVSYIDVLRPKKKATAPIDRADIARCRSEIELALRTHRLPLPRAGPAGLRANELVHNRAAAALPTSGAQEEAQRRAIIDSACSAR